MATSTTYNAAYAGVLQGLALNRKAVNSTTVVAGVYTLINVADSIAAQIVSAMGALTAPPTLPINAAHQPVLQAIVSGYFANQVPSSLTIPAADATVIANEYVAWIAKITP
jgi:hypothetical protein